MVSVGSIITAAMACMWESLTGRNLPEMVENRWAASEAISMEPPCPMHSTALLARRMSAAWATASRFSTSRVCTMAVVLAFSSFWLMVSRESSRVISPERGLSSNRWTDALAMAIFKSGYQ